MYKISGHSLQKRIFCKTERSSSLEGWLGSDRVGSGRARLGPGQVGSDPTFFLNFFFFFFLDFFLKLFEVFLILFDSRLLTFAL